jgi:hypothetical protein
MTFDGYWFIMSEGEKEMYLDVYLALVSDGQRKYIMASL